MMKLCKDCVCTRVCGEKESYERYVEEMNKLHEDIGDHFPKNPVCPEFIHPSTIEIKANKDCSKEKESIEKETSKEDEHVEGFLKFLKDMGIEAEVIKIPVNEFINENIPEEVQMFEQMVNELKEIAGDRLEEILHMFSLMKTDNEEFNEFKDLIVKRLSLEVVNKEHKTEKCSSCGSCNLCDL